MSAPWLEIVEAGISFLWGHRAEISKILYSMGPSREHVGCSTCGKVFEVTSIERKADGTLYVPPHVCKDEKTGVTKYPV